MKDMSWDDRTDEGSLSMTRSSYMMLESLMFDGDDGREVEERFGIIRSHMIA